MANLNLILEEEVSSAVCYNLHSVADVIHNSGTGEKHLCELWSHRPTLNVR